MNKILITGATGNLGRGTVEYLLKRISTDQIITFVRNENCDAATLLKQQGIETRTGHYDDITSINIAMQGIKKVLLIPGSEINRYQQNINIVEAAKRAGVQHIVYASVFMKDSNTSAVNTCMGAHFKTEDYIKQSGLDYTILRNSLYADIIPLFIGNINEKKDICFPAGDGKASYVLRREMAEAIANILISPEHTNKIYELSNQKLYSYHDIATVLTAIIKRKILYSDCDPQLFSSQLQTSSLSDDTQFLVNGFAADIKMGQYEVLSKDLEFLIGRIPATLEESLKEIYKKNI